MGRIPVSGSCLSPLQAPRVRVPTAPNEWSRVVITPYLDAAPSGRSKAPPIEMETPTSSGS